MLERLHRTAAAIFLVVAVPWLLLGSVYSFQEPHGGKIGHGSDQRAKNQLHNEQYGIWGHSDPGVTLFTLLLVVVGAVQVGLFLAQLKLIRESLIDAKKAADAAEKGADAAKANAEALISAERARLYPVIERTSLEGLIKDAPLMPPEQDDYVITTRPAVDFFFKNLGKTPAIITQLSYRLRQLPPRKFWDYTMPGVTLFYPFVDGNDQTKPSVTCSLEDLFKVRDAKAALNGSKPIHFYGYVVYVDSFRRQHTHFWRYQNRGVQFVLVHSEERTEEAKESSAGLSEPVVE